jgi:hypothetical protein
LVHFVLVALEVAAVLVVLGLVVLGALEAVVGRPPPLLPCRGPP